MTFRALAPCLLGAVVALAGCGSDDDGGAKTVATTPAGATAPAATAPGATEPPRGATGPAAAPPGGAEHRGREQDQGGAEPVRVPAVFTLRGGALRPSRITVPAFIAVEIAVRNLDPVTRTVTVRADRAYRLTVPAGRRVTRLVPGQRAGAYRLVVRGGGQAVLVTGGEPGP